jgi:hypothetical protein
MARSQGATSSTIACGLARALLGKVPLPGWPSLAVACPAQTTIEPGQRAPARGTLSHLRVLAPRHFARSLCNVGARRLRAGQAGVSRALMAS